jgi:hypothetical protein
MSIEKAADGAGWGAIAGHRDSVGAGLKRQHRRMASRAANEADGWRGWSRCHACRPRPELPEWALTGASSANHTPPGTPVAARVPTPCGDRVLPPAQPAPGGLRGDIAPRAS